MTQPANYIIEHRVTGGITLSLPGVLPFLSSILQLAKDFTMNQADFAAALAIAVDSIQAVSTSLDTAGASLTKGLDEVVVALSQIGNTTPAMDSALSKLQALGAALAGQSTALATAAKALDDLTPDAPPAGG